MGSFVNVFPFIKVLYPRKFLVKEQLTKNISYKIMLLFKWNSNGTVNNCRLSTVTF